VCNGTGAQKGNDIKLLEERLAKATKALKDASVIIGDEYGEKSEQFREIARAIKELETV
jgi:hypothetical protein